MSYTEREIAAFYDIALAALSYTSYVIDDNLNANNIFFLPPGETEETIYFPQANVYDTNRVAFSKRKPFKIGSRFTQIAETSTISFPYSFKVKVGLNVSENNTGHSIACTDIYVLNTLPMLRNFFFKQRKYHVNNYMFDYMLNNVLTDNKSFALIGIRESLKATKAAVYVSLDEHPDIVKRCVSDNEIEEDRIKGILFNTNFEQLFDKSKDSPHILFEKVSMASFEVVNQANLRQNNTHIYYTGNYAFNIKGLINKLFFPMIVDVPNKFINDIREKIQSLA